MSPDMTGFLLWKDEGLNAFEAGIKSFIGEGVFEEDSGSLLGLFYLSRDMEWYRGRR